MGSALTAWPFTIFRATLGPSAKTNLDRTSPALEVATQQYFTQTICSFSEVKMMTPTSLLTFGLIIYRQLSGKKLPSKTKEALSLVVGIQLIFTETTWSFLEVSETLFVSLMTCMFTRSEKALGPLYRSLNLLLEILSKTVVASLEALEAHPT